MAENLRAQWESSQSLAALTKQVQARNESEAQIRLLVERMHEQGCPWTVIAEVLGVTRQAAAKKYGPKSANADQADAESDPLF